MKRYIFLILASALPLFAVNLSAAVVKYEVVGLAKEDKAAVSLGSTSFLSTKVITGDGEFDFEDVPDGEFQLKITAPGYKVSDTRSILIDQNQVSGLELSTKLEVFPIEPDPSHWEHEWKQNESVEGATMTSHIFSAPEIDFLGKKYVPANVPYYAILRDHYNILLSDKDETWTQEYAYRLVETLKTLPSYYSTRALFILTSDKLTDDIDIEKIDGCEIVAISKDAFVYANPLIVNIEGVRGKFYSKRLHHAMTKFVTDFGKDSSVVNLILTERFGVSINIPDYSKLTSGITNEDEESFQKFEPSELVAIINMFEEMPEGFHKTPYLNYLVRRRDGLIHPIYPDANGVTWCVDNGYIEFMKNDQVPSFSGNNESLDTQMMIIHEKVHFLWGYVIRDDLKKEWIKLGGWYRDSEDSYKWTTADENKFINEFTHEVSPEEDLAVSIAYYIKNPERLLSEARDKYEFIHDRVMHGTRYLSSIPEHLTFEVLNLLPDYDYPGKIIRVNISVDGAPDEDKTITVEIELNHSDRFPADASKAWVRVTGPSFIDESGSLQPNYVDVWLIPDSEGYILRGSAIVSKYAQNGEWTCGPIQIYDNDGNPRYDSNDDCVTDVYINNPLEDLESPVYVPGSLEYEITEGVEEGHAVKYLKVSYEVEENAGVISGYARLANDIKGWYGLVCEGYGTYNEESGKVEIIFILPEFCPTAYYYVKWIESVDMSGISSIVNFSDQAGDEPVKKILIETSNPDTEAPEIDLNRITVTAQPTHPDNPDGETLVTINVYCRDNISGLGLVQYAFRDPKGSVLGNYWFNHENYTGYFFSGDPTAWFRYEITHLLPIGSTPGIWGINSIILHDKAGNERIYNFVETLIFEPDDNDDYVLFADFFDASTLTLSLSSELFEIYEYSYRVLHDDSGKEITGEVIGCENTAENLKVDISKFDPGKLSLFVNIKDNEGKIVSVKSKTLVKDNDIFTNVFSMSGERMLNISTVNGKVYIEGADDNESVKVYSLTGSLIYTGDVKRIRELTLEKGVYIIAFDNYSSKISVL